MTKNSTSPTTAPTRVRVVVNGLICDELAPNREVLLWTPALSSAVDAACTAFESRALAEGRRVSEPGAPPWVHGERSGDQLVLRNARLHPNPYEQLYSHSWVVGSVVLPSGTAATISDSIPGAMVLLEVHGFFVSRPHDLERWVLAVVLGEPDPNGRVATEHGLIDGSLRAIAAAAPTRALRHAGAAASGAEWVYLGDDSAPAPASTQREGTFRTLAEGQPVDTPFLVEVERGNWQPMRLR